MSRIITALKSAIRWSRGDRSAGKSTIVHVPDKPGTRELAAMHAIRVLRGNAYDIAIMEEVQRATRRDIGRGSVSLALDWIEQHGFAVARVSKTEIAGRNRRYFTITPKGEEALRG